MATVLFMVAGRREMSVRVKTGWSDGRFTFTLHMSLQRRRLRSRRPAAPLPPSRSAPLPAPPSPTVSLFFITRTEELVPSSTRRSASVLALIYLSTNDFVLR